MKSANGLAIVPTSVPIALIETNGGTQSRAELNAARVAEYSVAMLDGDRFPPVDLYYDGERYWLVDGFHRVAAARKADFVDVPACVKQGSQSEAVWASLAANREHDRAGLYRSNADKRRAVERALAHPEGQRRSDNGIAQHVGVTQQFVSKVRGELVKIDAPRLTTVVSGELEAAPSPESATHRVDKNGRKMNVEKIGKRASEPKLPPSPPSSPEPAPLSESEQLEQLRRAHEAAKARVAAGDHSPEKPSRVRAPVMRDVPLDEPPAETITETVVERLASEQGDTPSFAEVERAFAALSRAHQAEIVDGWLKRNRSITLSAVDKQFGFAK